MHSGQNRFPKWQNFLQEFPPYAFFLNLPLLKPKFLIVPWAGHNVGIPTILH